MFNFACIDVHNWTKHLVMSNCENRHFFEILQHFEFRLKCFNLCEIFYVNFEVSDYQTLRKLPCESPRFATLLLLILESTNVEDCVCAQPNTPENPSFFWPLFEWRQRARKYVGVSFHYVWRIHLLNTRLWRIWICESGMAVLPKYFWSIGSIFKLIFKFKETIKDA